MQVKTGYVLVRLIQYQPSPIVTNPKHLNLNLYMDLNCVEQKALD
jgi:hypothetical protein